MAKASWVQAQSVRKLKAELHDGTSLLDQLQRQRDPVAFLNATKPVDGSTTYANVSTERLQTMLYRYVRGPSVSPTLLTNRSAFGRKLGHIEKEATKQGIPLEVALLKGLKIDPTSAQGPQGVQLPGFSKVRLSNEAQKLDDAKRIEAVATVIVKALCQREEQRKAGAIIEPSANVVRADEKALRHKTKMSRVSNLIGYAAFGLYKTMMNLPQYIGGALMGVGILIVGTPLLLVQGLFDFLKYGGKGKAEWNEMKAQNAAYAKMLGQLSQPMARQASTPSANSQTPSYATFDPAFGNNAGW